MFHSRQNHKSKNVIYSLGTSHRRWVAGELVKRGWQVIHIIERGKVWIPRSGDEGENSEKVIK